MPLIPKRDRAGRDLDAQMPPAKDSPWGGLRSRFLASLDPADQVRIFDLSARTSQTLHRWAARYPLIRRVRVWPLSLSVAAGAPFTSVDALISTARLSLWVFTLDDLFDEERVPQSELMKRALRYRALAHREIACPAGDSLATALCELRDDLATYPLFGPLRHHRPAWRTYRRRAPYLGNRHRHRRCFGRPGAYLREVPAGRRYDDG